MGEKRQLDRIRYNKNNIIETAKQLFTEKGIVQTTMADIAKTADYSKSTIYVYFKSKEEIYHHIILEYMTTLRDGLTTVMQEKNRAKDRYDGLCKVLIQLHEKSPLFFKGLLAKIEVSAQAMEEEPVLGEIYTVGEEVNHVIETFLQEGMDEGVIRQDLPIPPTVFIMWASLCQNIIMAEEKKEYIAMKMSLTKDEYLQTVFDTLYKTIDR
ncbi:TetR/AcrR family transcriptional regulator [Anaerosporobacter faecicola]|uniref:TetR/AcrR family transcriptional regulator n=1 Tax=Anaerosporobacter faecicola TaxID=2718714 RepID=UPI00143B5FD4|nr:TetR/AcrR family transcriptional regulator [Anaerosporobacter faecicola]